MAAPSLEPLTTCADSASFGPSEPIAARTFGSGPMLPARPAAACACPVDLRVERRVAGVSVLPLDSATLETSAALAATIGDALEVPENVLVYAALLPGPPWRPP